MKNSCPLRASNSGPSVCKRSANALAIIELRGLMSVERIKVHLVLPLQFF